MARSFSGPPGSGSIRFQEVNDGLSALAICGKPEWSWWFVIMHSLVKSLHPLKTALISIFSRGEGRVAQDPGRQLLSLRNRW
jgi:hypothetical protein